MPLSAVDVVSPAFERMKSCLFQPFRLGQWLRLALVGLLAGEIGQSSGCSARMPLDLADVLSSQPSREFQGPLGPERSVLFLVGVALAVVLGLIVVVLFMYINSRMRFVLFDSIIDRECRVRQSWRRRGTPAFGYFLFQLLMTVVSILSLVVLFGIPLLAAFGLGWFENPRQHILALVLGGVVLVFVFLGWVLTMLLVHVLTKDFVVPQMAVDGVSVSTGWNRLWALMKEDKGGYAGYIGMKIALAIAAAIVMAIAGLIVAIVLLIPFGVVALVAVFAGQAAGLGWNPVTIAVGIVFAAIIFLLLFVLLCLVSVPAVFFFPAYSVYFFAERHAGLRALLYPPSPEPDLSSPSLQP